MSKGGSNTSSTQVPAWLENAAIENINKGREVSQIGYTPYYGPDVAAFSPMQAQSMRSTGSAADAFGLGPAGTVPQGASFGAHSPTWATDGIQAPQTFAGGIQGYSSAPLYEESLQQLQQNRPGQFNAINNMFIDPYSGAPAQGNYKASPTQFSQMFSNGGDMGDGSVSGGGNAALSTGEYYGVNEQYNPLGYSYPTKDISGDGDTDYRDMSFGEDGRRDIGFGENFGNFIKSATGIGAIEKAMDYGQGLADGFTPSPFNGLLTQTSGQSMTPEESMRLVNENAERYSRLSNDRGFNPNSIESQYDQRGNMYPSDIMSLISPNGYQSEQLAENARIEAEARRVQARIAEQTAISNAAALARQSNGGGDGAGAEQRSAAVGRNSGGGGYGGGGGSYDPSGRW
jgi:hypothetical protein